MSEGGYAVNFGKSRGPGFDPSVGAMVTRETKSEFTQWHLAAGATYFVNENIALELLSTYSSQASYARYLSNEFSNTTSNLVTQIGLQVYFPRK